ncbi:MAG: hypothetical protein K6T94_22565 [Paenibacillus sp.]|nr:hypothetical protein [Paenibacillus sp.]
MRGVFIDDIEKDLKNKSGDYLHSAVKAAMSAIPLVGGSASEIVSMLISSPISIRRDKWLIKLSKGIDELKTRMPEFDIESLNDNEVFITTVLHASQAAIRNHQEEKLIALRNAVLNSAVGISIDESILLIFLSLIDTLTPWHLRILKLFQDPNNWSIDNGVSFYNLGSLSDLVESAFNELRGKRSFYDVVVKDLNNQGLLGTASLHGMMTGSGVMAPRTTEFGNLLFSYTSFPY